MESGTTALYTRVSEGGQHPENQIRELLDDLKASDEQPYRHQCKNISEFDKLAAKTLKGIKDPEQYAQTKKDMEYLRQCLLDGIFIDYGHTGTKQHRMEFEEMLQLVDQQEDKAPEACPIRKVEVWAIDRFTREGIPKLFRYLEFFGSAT